MEEGRARIAGIVRSVVYQNEDTGFAVVRIALPDDEEETVVTGCAPYIAPGEELEVEGEWSDHPAYGRQFKGLRFDRGLPSDEEGVLTYLSSGIIKGVGPVSAKLIVSRFGEESLDILANEPERLAEIKGLSAAKAKRAGEQFRRHAGMRITTDFLVRHGFEPSLALPLYRKYGPEGAAAVRENPYLLVGGEFGVEFSRVDTVALSLGIDGNSPERLRAALLYELAYNMDRGHSFIPRDKLIAATAALLKWDEDDGSLSYSYEELVMDGRVCEEEVAGHNAAYLYDMRVSEAYVAARLLRMTEDGPDEPDNLELHAHIAAQECGVELAPLQLEAVLTAGRGRLMLLTGGPGTGKTTAVRAVIALYARLGLKTALTAPTGRAAKRMSELCGADAFTLHRLLEIAADSESGKFGFVHDEGNPLEYDAVIVDETSMIDIRMMHALLLALPSEARLVLVGDPDQLPSVGPGNVLCDIITAGIADTVALKEIFRQAQTSAIITNAHAVNRGEANFFKNTRESDFFFVRCGEKEETVATVVSLCRDRIPGWLHIDHSCIQVLTPTRRYETGTNNLNRVLQEALNPPAPDKPERMYGDYVFRVGDRVMQVRNNYDISWRRTDMSELGSGVFNGDVGRILGIDARGQTVTVLFDDRLVDYDFEMLADLEPAYAMTVHKSQGSEYDVVILVVGGSGGALFNRKVLYTAITRAKTMMVVVGEERTLVRMAGNDRPNSRYSGLAYRLTHGVSDESIMENG